MVRVDADRDRVDPPERARRGEGGRRPARGAGADLGLRRGRRHRGARVRRLGEAPSPAPPAPASDRATFHLRVPRAGAQVVRHVERAARGGDPRRSDDRAPVPRLRDADAGGDAAERRCLRRRGLPRAPPGGGLPSLDGARRLRRAQRRERRAPKARARDRARFARDRGRDRAAPSSPERPARSRVDGRRDRRPRGERRAREAFERGECRRSGSCSPCSGSR